MVKKRLKIAKSILFHIHKHCTCSFTSLQTIFTSQQPLKSSKFEAGKMIQNGSITSTEYIGVPNELMGVFQQVRGSYTHFDKSTTYFYKQTVHFHNFVRFEIVQIDTIFGSYFGSTSPYRGYWGPFGLPTVGDITYL